MFCAFVYVLVCYANYGLEEHWRTIWTPTKNDNHVYIYRERTTLEYIDFYRCTIEASTSVSFSPNLWRCIHLHISRCLEHLTG